MAPVWQLIHRPERLTPSLGNVSPSSCSYPATLRTASAVILPCIISALPLGPIREYGHAAAVTTGTSAATIPCIQPISTTTGSGGPILRVDVHTDLSMPDRRLSATHRPYVSGIAVTWRLNQRLSCKPPRSGVILTSGYFFLAGLSSPEMVNRLIGTVFITHPAP